MKTFLEYHLNRQIEEILSESEWTAGQPWYSSDPSRPRRRHVPFVREDPSMDDDDLYRRGVLEGDRDAMKRLDQYWRPLFVGKFHRRFDSLSLEDVEDAYQRTFSSLISRRIEPREDERIIKLFQVAMRNSLIDTVRSKGKQGRALASYSRERPMSYSTKHSFEEEGLEDVIARTPNLTPREIKALRLAATGISARNLGPHLDPPVTAPTGWRVYDSAVSKIRVAHGLTSTRQERDRRKSAESSG